MSTKPKKTKSRKKLADLEAALDEERRRAETYLSQLKYAKADLENLQKRTQKRIEEAVDRASWRLLLQLLPILDELELAIEVAHETGGDILKGVEMVSGKLEKLLATEGVTPIKAQGEPFDPHLHEAVLEVETNEVPDGRISEEMRKGYIYKDRVLRASMVKVAKNQSSRQDQEEVENE